MSEGQPESRIRSIEAFLQALDRSFEDAGQVWRYRGQIKLEWDLLPKVQRPAFIEHRHILDWEHTSREEQELAILNEFKKTSRPFLADGPPQNEWEWLALAQHHGLATRLLDWTANPLAALYFAVETYSGTDSVVWCISVRLAA